MKNYFANWAIEKGLGTRKSFSELYNIMIGKSRILYHEAGAGIEYRLKLMPICHQWRATCTLYMNDMMPATQWDKIITKVALQIY